MGRQTRPMSALVHILLNWTLKHCFGLQIIRVTYSALNSGSSVITHHPTVQHLAVLNHPRRQPPRQRTTPQHSAISRLLSSQEGRLQGKGQHHSAYRSQDHSAAKKAASKAKDGRSYGRHSAPTGIIGKHTPPARTHQHQGRPYQRPPSSGMATSNPRMDQVLTTQSSPQHTEEPDLSASDAAEDMEVNQTIQESSDEFSTSGVTSKNW